MAAVGLRSLAIGRSSLRAPSLSRAVRCSRHLSLSWTRQQNDVTHTGQYWEKEDYRNVRFVDKKKQVNQQFAIDLVAEEPVVVIDGNHTYCDGGPDLGHPRVFINLDRPEIQVCPYCGRRFVAQKYKELFSHLPLTFVHE